MNKMFINAEEMDKNNSKQWLSRAEFSSLAGLSLSSIYRMIKSGIITSLYLAYAGRRVLISTKALEDLSSLTKGRPRYLLKKEMINVIPGNKKAVGL
jgi:hypothetical protein